MRTAVIAIDGCGGAGKSTLAEQLSKLLDDCAIVHTDDFASWDNPIHWYPRLISEVLEPLSTNQAARYQQYDWKTMALAQWLTVAPASYVILEGVTAARKEFRPYLSFSIFVDTPRDVCLTRGLIRDGEAAREQWKNWMVAEDEYLAQHEPMNIVDVVLSGEAKF